MSLPLCELAATQTYLFVFIHCCENKQSEQIMMQQLLFFILVTKLFTLDIYLPQTATRIFIVTLVITQIDLYF